MTQLGDGSRFLCESCSGSSVRTISYSFQLLTLVGGEQLRQPWRVLNPWFRSPCFSLPVVPLILDYLVAVARGLRKLRLMHDCHISSCVRNHESIALCR